MMKSIIIVLFLTFVFLNVCNAEEFCIEDQDLKPVPENAVRAILSSERNPDWKTCRFLGKPINLDGDGKSKDLFVTTADGCGCGNALCTIWVLQPKRDSYSVVLSDGGYCMKIKRSKIKKMPDIAFEASTAGWSQESLWKFNGKRYIRVKLKTN
ncbi:MAG: hypothetical protein NT178_11205 [Proteobacteria bacterium]|nr:hypothetical protein [Pseudomonadota bacterium]